MSPAPARVAFAVLLLLALQELALRAVFPLPEVANFDRSAYSYMGFSPGGEQPSSLGHAAFVWASDPDGFEFVHWLNLYGFRDHTWPTAPTPGVERIAFVGDSFVEGFSAPGDDTIPVRFAGLAADDGIEVETLNLGVGGGDLSSYARLLRDALPIFRPRTVILVLFANDVVEKRPTRTWDDVLVPQRPSRLAPRIAWVVDRLRAGQRVPRRWHDTPFPFLPAVPDPRNPWSDGRRAGQLAFVDPEIARAARHGRFNPMLPDALPWFEKALRRPVDMAPHLRAFRDHAAELGASLGVVYLPTKMQVSDRYLPFASRYSPPGSAVSLLGEPYQRHAAELAASCRALGLPFLDLTPSLRQAEREGNALYWDYDDHMRPAGYRTAAALILAWWKEGRPWPTSS